MDLQLTDKFVVVTGAAQGIGYAIARGFAEEGARVLLLDRDSAVENTADKLGAKSLVCDLSTKETAIQLAKVANENGGCDVLVNNAGISIPASIDQITDEDWSQVLNVNLDAAFRLIRSVWGQLIQNQGSVVNIASFASKRATLFGNNSSYTVSKHGIAGLTRAAAMDGAKQGVRVNGIAPGVVNTDLVKLHDEQTRERIGSMIPIGHYAEPEEIANVVVFLASYRASHMTGEVVNVNGGLVMD